MNENASSSALLEHKLQKGREAEQDDTWSGSSQVANGFYLSTLYILKHY